ncbi:MAG: 30S ribosomal protein S21 [Pseudomonadota bacterium]|nr:30S ribosomal protein S21 [Pseudomonadota bacterium]
MPEIEVSRCGSLDTALRRLSKDRDKEMSLKSIRDRYHIKPTEQRKRDKAAAKKRAKKKEEKEQMIKNTFQLSYRLTLARQGKRECRNKRRRFQGTRD